MVGDGLGQQRNMTSLAHLVSVLYLDSHGFSEIPFSFDEKARKGAVLRPTLRVYAAWLEPSGWHAWEASAEAKRVTPVGLLDGIAVKVGPRCVWPSR